jgi:hypothetical protein
MLQQAGYTEFARAIGRFEHLEERVYRQMWFRAKQFYTDPMWIRITGEGRAPDFLQINEVVSFNETPQLVAGPDGQPLIDPMTGQPAIQMVREPVMKNRLAEMDVDIIVSCVPDTGTLKQEVWAEVMRLAGSLGINPLAPEMRALIKISPMPDATALVEQLKEIAEEAAAENAEANAGQAEAAQQAQQLAMEAQQARTLKDMAAANKHSAEATRVELETAQQHPLIPQQQPPHQAL